MRSNIKVRNTKLLVANILASINSGLMTFLFVIIISFLRSPEFVQDLEAELSSIPYYQELALTTESLARFMSMILIGCIIVMVLLSALGWFSYIMNNKGLVLASAICYAIIGIILLVLLQFGALFFFGFYYVAVGIFIYCYSHMTQNNIDEYSSEQIQYPEHSTIEDEIHIID